MEFVVVEFPRTRQVFIDDTPQGMTGQRQAVQEGHHVFDLGEPVDYTPARQELRVIGTSAGAPLSIVFFPTFAVTASLPDIPEVVPPVPRARARARTRPKPKKTTRKRPSRKTKRAATRKGKTGKTGKKGKTGKTARNVPKAKQAKKARSARASRKGTTRAARKKR